ncbi:MAG: hypothetical protein WC601_11350 [Desulfotomaculaceae bacterium]
MPRYAEFLSANPKAMYRPLLTEVGCAYAVMRSKKGGGGDCCCD